MYNAIKEKQAEIDKMPRIHFNMTLFRRFMAVCSMKGEDYFACSCPACRYVMSERFFVHASFFYRNGIKHGVIKVNAPKNYSISKKELFEQMKKTCSECWNRQK